MIGVGLVAVWRGRDSERLAATGVLAGWALSMVVARSRSNDTQWGIFAVDALLLLLFLWLALRSRRFWPLFVAAFQLLMVLTHFASILDAGVSGWAYLTANLIWSYMVVLTIGYAAWTAPAYDPPATDGPTGPSQGTDPFAGQPF